MTSRASIEEFWKFWATVKDEIARGFSEGGLSEPLIAAIGEQVNRIDPALDWEFGPGRESQHHLCLSAKGDPVLRVVAERWRHLAPEADATWEYYASRQPHPAGGLNLEIDGHVVALDEIVVGVELDDAREVLHVTLHHPLFAEIADDELRFRIGFIGLDTLLGEDDVERWIGAIDASESAPENGIPLPALRDAVRALAEQATGDKWVILQGEIEGQPIFVSKNAALKRINHLLHDTHVEIDIPLLSPTEAGLTTAEEAEQLDAMEDALFTALGEDAVYVARETFGGRRRMHLHVMEAGPAASSIERWRSRNAEREIGVQVAMDPRWEILERWG